MIYLLFVLIALFFAGILLKKIFPKLCALCFAGATTWILGLIYVLTYGSNPNTVDTISVAIIMGGSVVGSMYYIFSRVPKIWQIYKLPYVTTLFALVYLILSRSIIAEIILTVLVVWVVFVATYWFRDTHLKTVFKKIIECCKNW